MGGEFGWNPNRERERFTISRYLKRGLRHDGSDRKIELLNGIIYIAIAKSFFRFEVALCRHSGVRRNPVFSIPRHAGLDPGFRRGDGSKERHHFWQLL
jgi:hypothetical protein